MMYPATHTYPRPVTPHANNEREQRRWRPDFARIRGRVYLAVADQIEHAILTGIFLPGDALPTQRSIADDLGFHLNTINAAFREVARRGLIFSLQPLTGSPQGLCP
ncbi:GntR family transcriptional regulator [Paraburkholderia sp. JHI869]|uniref:winged helix-turn-helix domain-containing protein n=1 Tax=Paraburkholderia sp. JHI869 TaxID=3112959 RepID=UPI00317AFCA5